MGRAVVDTHTRTLYLLILNLSEDTVELPTLRRVAAGRSINGVAEVVQPSFPSAEPVDYARMEALIPDH